MNTSVWTGPPIQAPTTSGPLRSCLWGHIAATVPARSSAGGEASGCTRIRVSGLRGSPLAMHRAACRLRPRHAVPLSRLRASSGERTMSPWPRRPSRQSGHPEVALLSLCPATHGTLPSGRRGPFVTGVPPDRRLMWLGTASATWRGITVPPAGAPIPYARFRADSFICLYHSR